MVNDIQNELRDMAKVPKGKIEESMKATQDERLALKRKRDETSVENGIARKGCKGYYLPFQIK